MIHYLRSTADFSPSRMRMKPVLAWTAALLLLIVLLGGCGTPSNVHVIEMQDLSFNPETVTVKKGDTVRWVNKDQTAHNPTSDDFNSDSPDQSPPSAWSAQPVNPGASFERVFDAPGTVDYHCEIHQYMKARIIVED
jgi:plastocyanin